MKKPDCNNCEIFKNNMSDATCLNVFVDCEKCEKMKKYKAHLESKKKFTKGEQITDINELIKQEFVYMYSRPMHKEVVLSQTLRTILSLLENSNGICCAIRKDVTK